MSSCLFVSYDGLLDPLGQSQILPYLLGLSNSGVKVHIFSFEKTDKTPSEILQLHHSLTKSGIGWTHLPFQNGRLRYLSRLFLANIYITYLVLLYRPKLLHFRTVLSASLACLPLLFVPFLLDVRAFAGEWITCGRIAPRSPQAYFLRLVERYCLSYARSIVVLDHSAYSYILKNHVIRGPVYVIPTSTDMSLYEHQHSPRHKTTPRSIRLVYLGGVRPPYLPILAFQLQRRISDCGYTCSLDFINYSDHDYLHDLASSLTFKPCEYTIFKLPHSLVPQILPQYDIGLVFNEYSYWRSMSSPTKIGEFLASGLHVVGNRGIHALSRLSDLYPDSVTLYSTSSIFSLSDSDIHKLVEYTSLPNRQDKARIIAENHYSLEQAVETYLQAYQAVLHD